MAVSMFGVVASAKDINEYPDVDEITYTEAVGVLSGLGVLQGDERGFAPKDGLTRAEAAKIAVYLVALQDNKVEDGTKFTDVVGHWGENEITIAESVQLINGNGDGTFDPDGALTGYAWEKMCLSALGYSAEIEGMLGDSWEGGVLKLSDKLDLRAGLKDDYDATKPITREQAAQIAFNALKKYTVYYPVSGGTNSVAIQQLKDGTLGKQKFGLTKEYETDIFGAESSYSYTNGKTSPKTKVVYCTTKIDPIADYSNETGLTLKGIAAEAGLTKGDVIKIYEDGVLDTTYTVGDKDVKLGDQLSTDVLLYVDYEINEDADGNKYYDLVIINNYVKVLSKSDIAAAQGPDAAYIRNLAYGLKYETDAYVPGDVVVYNVGSTDHTKGVTPNKVVNVEELTPVYKEVSARHAKNNTVTFEDEATATQFAKQAIVSASNNVFSIGAAVDVYYVDGNIIYARDAVLDCSDAVVAYMYNAKIDTEKVGVGSAAYYNVSFEANVVLMDGTLETINVATAYDGPILKTLNKYGRIDGSSHNVLQDKNNPSVCDNYECTDFVYDDTYGSYGFVKLYAVGDEYAVEDVHDVELNTKGDSAEVNITPVITREAPYTLYATSSTNNTVIEIDSVTAPCADGTATTSVGTKLDVDTNVSGTNGDRTDGIAYYEVNAENELKITDIYVIKPYATSNTYAMYLGRGEENRNGQAYVFGLADGSTLEIYPSVRDGKPISFAVENAVSNGDIGVGTVVIFAQANGELTGVQKATEISHGGAMAYDSDNYLALNNVSLKYQPLKGVSVAWTANPEPVENVVKNIQDYKHDLVAFNKDSKGDFVHVYGDDKAGYFVTVGDVAGKDVVLYDGTNIDAKGLTYGTTYEVTYYQGCDLDTDDGYTYGSDVVVDVKELGTEVTYADYRGNATTGSVQKTYTNVVDKNDTIVTRRDAYVDENGNVIDASTGVDTGIDTVTETVYVPSEDGTSATINTKVSVVGEGEVYNKPIVEDLIVINDDADVSTWDYCEEDGGCTYYQLNAADGTLTVTEQPAFTSEHHSYTGVAYKNCNGNENGGNGIANVLVYTVNP